MRNKVLTCIFTLISIALLTSQSLAATTSKVHVTGLFTDTAVVVVNGKQYVLRQGQSTPEGVTLIKADSDAAWLKIDGKTQHYPLGHSTHYKVKPKVEDSVNIVPDKLGMYRVSGKVNDQSVTFIVDTGASHIAMNSHQADLLELDYTRAGKQAMVETASGTERAYVVQLKKVQVGSIVVRNVLALVIDGRQPSQILLGMSFLENVEMQSQGRTLQLIQK